MPTEMAEWREGKKLPLLPAVHKSRSLHAVIVCSDPSQPQTLSSSSSTHFIDNYNNCQSSSSSRPYGWYKARKTYRSVAYRTWKVGCARRVLSGHPIMDCPPTPSSQKTSTFDNHVYSTSQPEEEQSQRREMSKNNLEHSVYMAGEAAGNGDCFSSSEYCKFTRDSPTADHSQPTEVLDDSVQSVIDSFRELHQYASLRRPSQSRRYAYKRPQIFGHKRSQSAGNAAVFSVLGRNTHSKDKDSCSQIDNLLISKNSTKRKKEINCPSTSSNGPLQLTKNFLRRFYPSSLKNTNIHNNSRGQTQKVSFLGEVEPQNVLDRLLEPVEAGSVDSGYHGSDRSGPSSDAPYRSTPTPMSVSWCEATTVAETGRASLLKTTDKGSVPPAASLPDRPFKSWNDIFDHLKREISNMRARDVSILRDLQRLEQQLHAAQPPVSNVIHIVSPNLQYDPSNERCLTESMPL